MKYSTVRLFILCLAAISVRPVSGSAQSDSLAKGVKLYLNYQLMYLNSTQNQGSTREEFKMRQSGSQFISPALQLINSQGDFHELELSNLYFQHVNNKTTLHVDSVDFSQVTGGVYTRTFAIAFRYEYNFRLLKSREFTKIQPYIGFALNPYFSAYSIQPKVSSVFPAREFILGNQFMIIPRLQYHVNDRWYFDLNVPISMLNLMFSREVVENQHFTLEEQQTNTFSSEWLPRKLLVRLGVGLNL